MIINILFHWGLGKQNFYWSPKTRQPCQSCDEDKMNRYGRFVGCHQRHYKYL